MVTGFFLAIAAGFVWSIVNVVDKAAVSRFIKSPIIMAGVYYVVSLIVGLFMLLFTNIDFTLITWLWIILSAMLFGFGNLCYYYAIKYEEASRIVPLFSLSTVFLVVLSAIFLGEVFSVSKYFGIGLVVVGSALIMARGSLRSSFNTRAVWIMTASCMSYSIAYVITKHLLSANTYGEVFAWQRIVLGLLGLSVTLVLWKKIVPVLVGIKKRYMVLQFGNEAVSVGAFLLFTAAMSYWYVTLVETVASVQFLFLFFWTLIVSRFRPRLFVEEINRRTVVQKSISIILIIIGVYLIA